MKTGMNLTAPWKKLSGGTKISSIRYGFSFGRLFRLVENIKSTNLKSLIESDSAKITVSSLIRRSRYPFLCRYFIHETSYAVIVAASGSLMTFLETM